MQKIKRVEGSNPIRARILLVDKKTLFSKCFLPHRDDARFSSMSSTWSRKGMESAIKVRELICENNLEMLRKEILTERPCHLRGTCMT